MSLQVQKNRLDPLADRGEVQVVSGLPLASGTHNRGVHVTDGLDEGAAGVAFVAQQGLASGADTPPEQLEPDLALVAVGRGEARVSARGVPSGAKIPCSRNPQKKRECAAQ
jgi:hypothetical protein